MAKTNKKRSIKRNSKRSKKRNSKRSKRRNNTLRKYSRKDGNNTLRKYSRKGGDNIMLRKSIRKGRNTLRKSIRKGRNTLRKYSRKGRNTLRKYSRNKRNTLRKYSRNKRNTLRKSIRKGRNTLRKYSRNKRMKGGDIEPIVGGTNFLSPYVYSLKNEDKQIDFKHHDRKEMEIEFDNFSSTHDLISRACESHPSFDPGVLKRHFPNYIEYFKIIGDHRDRIGMVIYSDGSEGSFADIPPIITGDHPQSPQIKLRGD